MANQWRHVASKRHHAALQQTHIATRVCQYKVHFALPRKPFVIALHSQYRRKWRGIRGGRERGIHAHIAIYPKTLREKAGIAGQGFTEFLICSRLSIFGFYLFGTFADG